MAYFSHKQSASHDRKNSIESTIVNISEVLADPSHRLDAKYWIDKHKAEFDQFNVVIPAKGHTHGEDKDA